LADHHWQHLGDQAPAMANHSLLVGADGRAWAVGAVGEDGWTRPMTSLATFQVRRVDGRLEVLVETVQVPGPAPDSCFGATAVAVDDGRSFLSVGGDCLGNPLDPDPAQLWEYRIDANLWYRHTDAPVDISGHSAVSTGDSVWVFGGTVSGELGNQVYRYHLASDTWSTVEVGADRPGPRRDHRAVLAGNAMLIFGGIIESLFAETLDDVWQLDLDTLSWTNKRTLPSGLASMALAVTPAEPGRHLKHEVLLYGGVVEADTFPLRVSDATLIYTSDVADLRDTLFVPAVARVQGSGAFFTSTIQMFNAGDSTLELELTFTPRQGSGGRTTTVHHTVLPGVMQTIGDPVTSVFGIPMGVDRVGSLIIDVVSGPADDLLVQSLISAQLDSGEQCGQLLPTLSVADALRPGRSAYLNTTEDPAANRVNVGVMALVDDTRVQITPLAAIGSALAPARSFELQAGGNLQVNDIHSAFGLGQAPDALIEVVVESGWALAFASVVDGNVAYKGTSDPTTVLPVSGGSDRVILLEIGSINGLNEFAGSASLTNHSDFEAIVRAEFHQRGVPGVTAEQTLAIASGTSVGFHDLVGDLFGIRGDVGSVVVRSLNDARISATGREFAIYRDPSGAIVGTAGQLIAGVTDRDLLTPIQTWHVIGLKQAGTAPLAERSHLAAFNPSDRNARITVSLFNGIDGAAEGSRSWTVRAGELIQVNNVITKINPLHDGDDKRVEIRVSEPVHLNVFRANRWGDPVTLNAAAR
jgi:hypothetical protein